MSTKLTKSIFLIGLVLNLSSCDNNKTTIIEKYQYKQPEQLSDGWQTASLDNVALDIAKIETLVNNILTGDYPQIDGLVVIKQNQLVFEKYFNGYQRNSKHELQSAVKSIDSALVGLAIQAGYLQDAEQPIYDLLPEFHDLDWSYPKDQLTLKDLLTMRSGMPCQDGTQGECNSQILNQQSSWAKYTLQQSLTSEPGVNFSYFTGLPVLSHTIVENVSGMALADFADTFLFTPLGITNFSWSFSPTGEALSGDMLPRDMAKFGQLYLDDGQWHGQQIINSQWVHDSIAGQVVAPQANGMGYGYWWWLGNTSNNQYQYYVALGAKDQYIFVIPEIEMVFVITSNTDTGQGFEILNNFIIPAVN